ncbi:MAG: FAD:protein FMN transferase [Bryobacterales bacterium]|nr:FAD:protein FMN transferase [Bryobacterales bacterium]
MWRKTLIGLAIAGLLVAVRYATYRESENGLLKVQRPLMGTVWTIEVAGHQPEAARKAIAAAYTELERIDRMMSEWRPDSPISAVNAAAGKHPVEAPAELREMLERSIHYSEITEGVFDVTWRGMGNIWRFDDAFAPPSPQEVERARGKINYRAIRIEGNRIYIPAGMNIGLGGIAKGYAVDRASQALKKEGFENFLVDGGGDILVSGTNRGNPWRLGIQDPRAERGRMTGMVKLTAGALVTSGDYERFRIVNGVRYHHIIDPRTGYPANASMSVSVLAREAEKAVVLAKGIFILGAAKGLDLARRENVDALVVDVQGKRHMTEGFARQFEQK